MTFEPATTIDGLRQRVISASMEAPQHVPGGFFRRAVAYVIDLNIVGLLLVFFLLVKETALEMAGAGGIRPVFGHPEDIEALTPLWTGLFILYFTFFTYWGGKTPGKMLMGLRVITPESDEISLGRALLRTFGYLLSDLTFFVGYLIAAFTPNKRALQDYVAGTRVIRVSGKS